MKIRQFFRYSQFKATLFGPPIFSPGAAVSGPPPFTIVHSLQIAITLKAKVVNSYTLDDSWSIDRDLSSGKSVSFSRGGGLLVRIGEKPTFFMCYIFLRNPVIERLFTINCEIHDYCFKPFIYCTFRGSNESQIFVGRYNQLFSFG